ncbi:hypothetical protein PHYSODRAFT_328367 [Phytophthora sojae]|uniref:Uncharacterized protein n=1 Tax=Phytophthora sojae (strain P6497) TaxID=1094619 RepID=G4Z588_PHYSP|nr:hypothetical protein PHYSODRAFT_328367 [Phytophthora sojae]EGZ20231.1 hypothetical protein PHYSODRAFT_328367 [Phytophthora sojae]|eukprot:XP_009522948.1 hypothetical protein PHYSODRAFT_328367 [Phytophthora sojae]
MMVVDGGGEHLAVVDVVEKQMRRRNGPENDGWHRGSIGDRDDGRGRSVSGRADEECHEKVGMDVLVEDLCRLDIEGKYGQAERDECAQRVFGHACGLLRATAFLTSEALTKTGKSKRNLKSKAMSVNADGDESSGEETGRLRGRDEDPRDVEAKSKEPQQNPALTDPDAQQELWCSGISKIGEIANPTYQLRPYTDLRRGSPDDP